MTHENQTQPTMQTPDQEQVKKAEAVGLDWGTWLLLYQAVIQFGPEAVILAKKLLEFFKNRQVFGEAASHHTDDEVKKLACENLCSCLDAACSASCLHDAVCGHDHE